MIVTNIHAENGGLLAIQALLGLRTLPEGFAAARLVVLQLEHLSQGIEGSRGTRVEANRFPQGGYGIL